MQSRHLEPLQELAAQTAHPSATDLLIARRLSRASDRRDGTCPAYFPIAYFPTRGLRICAFETIRVVVCKCRTTLLRMIACCLHIAMLTCMIESEMSCEIGGVQLRVYVSESPAEDVWTGIATSYLSITTWFYKAMQGFNQANLSWTACLSLNSG